MDNLFKCEPQTSVKKVSLTAIRSCLFNASVAVYDPYAKKIVDIAEFAGITRNPEYHLGGVGVDPKNEYLSIVVDTAASFNSLGQNLSGTNWFIQYDPDTKEELFRVNLTETSQGKYGGFQDVEHDPRGNIYIVGSFPTSILRVAPPSKKGEEPKVVAWYVSGPFVTGRYGTGGLASVGDVLLSNDNTIGQIIRFDTRAEKGQPLTVPLTPNATLGLSDAIYLPPKYDGKVLLVAEDASGISVLRSKDKKWKSAEYLGLVPNNSTAAQGGTATAPMQIGDSIYINEEFFADAPVSTYNAGNRTRFPLVDITAQVEALLKK
jgi:hypothetical protein